MPIGSYAHRLCADPIKKLKVRLFGDLDVHSHYRMRPLLEYARRTLPAIEGQSLSAIELGCGRGTNLFELAQHYPALSGDGYDINEASIAAARTASERLFPDRLRFQAADLRRTEIAGKYDLVLLIDFLEHIEDPRDVLARLKGVCHTGTEILISVPTPRYPRVFGRRFHREVGHVVDGYTLEQLNALLPAGFRLVYSQHNTGLAASLLCALYYRWLRFANTRPLRLAVSLPFVLFRRCDWWNGPSRSASLFAVYEKEESYD